MNDEEFSINSLLSKKLIFDMNSERTKKRMAQMQRIKNNINENDTPKEDKSTFNSTQCPNEDNNIISLQLNKKLRLDKNKFNDFDFLNNNSNNISNNSNSNVHSLLNPFLNSEDLTENESSNIEINVSDLDCEIHEYENNSYKNLSDISSREFAKNYLSSNSKSFIHLNNNLIAKAATKNEKNTNSYLLALCPELMTKNKEKNLDNYYVDDVIKEEIEIENPLKQDNNTIENKKSKDLIIDINTPIKIFHQKSKSGNCFKGLISNSPKISKKNSIKKEKEKEKEKEKNIINLNRKNIRNFSRIFFTPQKSQKFNLSKLSKIKYPISQRKYKSDSENKNKIMKKIINISSKNFSNKIPKMKMKIAILSNNNSRSNSLTNHIRNKTSFTNPSYVNKIESYTIYHSKYTNKLSNRNYNINNNNKLVNKTSFRLFEIKKAIKTLGNKISQKKKNTFGLFFPNSNNKINNSNSIILQKSFANFEISNRNKIINSMQKINFNPLSFYSKSLNELNKCKGNLFTILVSKEKYKKKNKQFLFKGLFEINQSEANVFASCICGVSNSPNIININDYENVLNYDLNKGEFQKYKFSSKGNKKFNCSTVLLY